MFRTIITIHQDTLLESMKRLLPLLVSTITSSLLISHGVRRDVVLHMLFKGDEVCLTFLGDQVRQLRPDEQSTKGILRKAKLILERGTNRKSHKVHPGVIVSRTTLDKLISRSLKGHGDTLKLKNDFKWGLDIRIVNFSKYTSLLFIVPLIPSDQQLLKFVNESSLSVRVSKTTLNAPQLIVLFHNEVDRHVY